MAVLLTKLNGSIGVGSVFARMLESAMVQAVTNTIKVDYTDASTIERTLDFTYSRVFHAPPDDALVNLLYCAEKYYLRLKSVSSSHGFHAGLA